MAIKLVVRRDLKEIFPKEFSNRELIGKFIDYVMNNFFQSSSEEYINGYIGKKTVALEKEDFYIPESTDERQMYQLTPSLVSKTSDGEMVVDYCNFINTLKLQGCDVNDQNRLLSNEYWSWCPPINIDMFLNYNFYYWVEEGPEPVEISIKTNAVIDILGKEHYFYIDEEGNKKEFLSGLRIKFLNDENEEYNNKVFIVEGVGQSIKLVDDSDILYSENKNPDYYVMERGCRDGNAWSLRNRWFHRSVVSQNTSNGNKNYKQAKKPIICFNRDVQLYNYGIYNRGIVDLLINASKNDIHGMEPQSIQGVELRDGMIIVLTGDGNIDNNKLYLVSGISTINTVILQPVINGESQYGNPIEGEGIIVKSGENAHKYFYYHNFNWIEGQQKENINQSPLFKLYDDMKVSLDSRVSYPQSTFRGSKLFDYKTTDDESAIIDADLGKAIITNGYGNYAFENILDEEEIEYLDYDTIKKYNGYKFFKLNGQDTYLNTWYLAKDTTSQYITTEINITDNKTFEDIYDDKDIKNTYTVYKLAYQPDESTNQKSSFIYKNGILIDKNLYFIKNKKLYFSESVELNTGDVLYIKLLVKKINETIANGYYFDLPLTLTANAKNENITEINYNECFDQLKSIIENQNEFEGNGGGNNNYINTKQDVSLGTEILQHSNPILKTMLLNSNQYTNVRNVLEYINEEYSKFKIKFRNVIISMSNSGEFVENSDINTVVETALSKINIGKEGLQPFYNNGVANVYGNCYIPATPAYLGLDNCYKPEFVIMNENNAKVLLCHDGSYESLFNDYRDAALLYMEQEIYNSIPSKWKNSQPVFNKFKHIPGKFRDTAYSLSEYNLIMSAFLEKWSNKNNVDYSKNTEFDYTNSFTWNYSTCVDNDGEQLYGSYRSIYMYYYDTFRPHTHPWEMLGFSNEPEWWAKRYGNAPYNSSNIPMWKDIENGYIAEGKLKGVHKEFVRPNLISKYLPVDIDGNLLDPVHAGIVKQEPISFYASQNWKAGDLGLMETIWRYTSEYRYSLQTVLYLMRPIEWVEHNWDTLNITRIFKDTPYEQMIYEDIIKRPSPQDIIVHNEQINGNNIRKIGIQQWIADYLTHENINISSYIGNPIRNITTQLTYRCGRYYKKDSLKILSDNYGVLPSQNYHMNLYKTQTNKQASYSAMIITRVENGYMLDGYDLSNPYFNVCTPILTGKKTAVEVNGKSVIYYNDWKLNEKDVKKIKYKTIFYSVQELFNVICGYGKYLENIENWVFNRIMQDAVEPIDFNTKAEDFIRWTSINPDNGTFIMLNPGFQGMTIKHNGFLDIVGQYINGFWTILDTNGNPVYNNEIKVYRHNGYSEIDTKNKVLTLIKANVVEYEHMILFDNKTIYNDVLYDPLLCIKTQRFKVIGTSVSDWDGTFYAPGYLVESDGAIPNYDKLAEDFKYFFDTDDVRSQSIFGDYAKKTIGYQKLPNMERLLIDDRNMFDFYKGMLKEKGTKRSFGKLNRSNYIMSSNDSSIKLYENWAFKLGNFGYTSDNYLMEFKIDVSKITQDPQIVSFTTNDEITNKNSVIELGWTNPNWLRKLSIKEENTFTFNDKNNKYPTGGFARKEDVNYLVANTEEFENIKEDIVDKETVWIVKGDTRDWDIYKKISNEFMSLKVRNIQGLKSFDSSKLDKNDYVYVCSDTLSENIDYIRDPENIMRNNNNIIESNGWSIFKYQGNNGYNNIVASPNGALKQADENTLFVMQGLTIDFPDGFDEENNKKYLRYTLDETKEITAVSSMKYIGIDNTGKLYAVSNIFAQDEEPQNEIKLYDLWFNNKEFKTYQYNGSEWVEKYYAVIGTVSIFEDGSTDSDDDIPMIETDYTFSPEWGKFTNGIVTCTKNENDKDWLYALSLHFENGTLPILISKDLQTITINETLYETDTNSKLNGAVFVKGRWINAIASDTQYYMLWCNTNGVAQNSLIYNAAMEMNWNNGHNTVYVNEFTCELSYENNIIDIKYNGKTIARYGITGYVPSQTKRNIDKFEAFTPFVLERAQEKMLNLDIIQSCYMVNDDTNETLSLVHLYDPIQGIFPNKVIDEINYITSIDPVDDYNDFYKWGDEKIGYLWWDLSQVRYVDYHQGDIYYRRNNWGKQLPGSEIAIMEWTKSNEKPEEGKYVEKTLYNYKTSSYETSYYYWKKNPSEIPEVNFRQKSALNISKIINSPQDEGIIWVAPIYAGTGLYKYSSFIIGNFDNVSTGNDFVVQFNFKNAIDFDEHVEWALIREGDDDKIPDSLWNKMKVSLIGYDDKGQLIPDISLEERNRYGISIRPRQSMFKSLIESRHNFVDIVNNIFDERDVLSSIDVGTKLFTDTFNEIDEYPEYDFEPFKSYLDMYQNQDRDLIGKNLLVLNDENHDNIWTLWRMDDIERYTLLDYQRYNVQKFWYYKDLYKDYESQMVQPLKTFNTESALNEYAYNNTLNIGDIFKVYNKDGKWELLQFKGYIGTSAIFNKIGLEDGTINLNSKIYDFLNDSSIINDKDIFIDNLTKYEYLEQESSIVLRKIISYFEK